MNAYAITRPVLGIQFKVMRHSQLGSLLPDLADFVLDYFLFAADEPNP